MCCFFYDIADNPSLFLDTRTSYIHCTRELLRCESWRTEQKDRRERRNQPLPLLRNIVLKEVILLELFMFSVEDRD